MNKFKKLLITLLKNKKFIYISIVTLLVLFSATLNVAFSAFTNSSSGEAANIIVEDLAFSLKVNGVPESIYKVDKNSEKLLTIGVESLNSISSKYELTYKVCSDSNCSTFINTPANFSVKYGTRIIDTITGMISDYGRKTIRIYPQNNTATDYYIKLDINSGYTHNTLALKNSITSSYEDDVLNVALLIEEGGINVINAKGTPNFSNPSPIVTGYTGKEPVEVTSLPYMDGILGGNSYTLGANKYQIAISFDYWGQYYYNTSDIGKYVCDYNDYMDNQMNFEIEGCNIIYEIKEVTEGIVTKAIKYEIDPIMDFSTSGMYKTEDDYGTSYYYRGAVENNYLEFAGMCWRIVRIVGDGSIKLVLYNYNPNSVSNPCDTSQDEPSAGFARYSGTTHTSAFNTYGDDAKTLGYMYSPSGTTTSTSRAQATTNSVSSTIKTNLDAWYTNKLNSYSGNISDTLWCNDRQTAKELGYNDGYQDTGLGYGANKTYYAAEYRLSITKTPTLKCGQKNDRFTVSDTVIGNGNLSNPVGLLTADEIAYAGGVYGNYNIGYYLSCNV